MNVIDVAFQSMDDVIGLQRAKAQLKHFVTGCLLYGCPSFPIFVFAGNPGTGKTLFAQRMGRVLKDVGLLSQGHTVSVSLEDLIAPSVGLHGLNLQARCEEALGGVLLVQNLPAIIGVGRGKPLDMEALRTILVFRETHRENLCIVFEGGVREMENALERDPAIMHRVSQTFLFPDLTDQEAAACFVAFASQRSFTCSEELREALPEIMARARQKGLLKGNAWAVQKILSDFIMTVARRMMGVIREGKQELVEQTKFTLTLQDIPAEYRGG